MSMVGRTVEIVFAVLHGLTICYGSTSWSQPSSLCISCCSAATWSSVQKLLLVLQPGPLPSQNDCGGKKITQCGMKTWYFRFPDAQMPTGACNHILAGAHFIVTAVLQLFVLCRSGHQHSSGIMCITHHLILLYGQHPSTMCALSRLLLGYPLPTCKILLLFPKFKRGRHAIQFLCLFKWRHLTLLESLLTMLSFPSSLLSDIGLNHIHDLQLFLNFRYFWMAEGHCFLFPKSMPSISMPWILLLPWSVWL